MTYSQEFPMSTQPTHEGVYAVKLDSGLQMWARFHKGKWMCVCHTPERAATETIPSALALGGQAVCWWGLAEAPAPVKTMRVIKEYGEDGGAV